jgi:hypothetical protein
VKDFIGESPIVAHAYENERDFLDYEFARAKVIEWGLLVLRQHPLSPARPRNGLGAGGAGAPHGRRAPALLLCSQHKSSHFTSARIDFQYLDPAYVFATPALGAQASLVGHHNVSRAPSSSGVGLKG